jgi:hypothetical protein
MPAHDSRASGERAPGSQDERALNTRCRGRDQRSRENNLAPKARGAPDDPRDGSLLMTHPTQPWTPLGPRASGWSRAPGDGWLRAPWSGRVALQSAILTRSSCTTSGPSGRSVSQSERYWREQCVAARDAITNARLGFADIYLVTRIDPLLARQQRDADLTRFRRLGVVNLADPGRLFPAPLA